MRMSGKQSNCFYLERVTASSLHWLVALHATRVITNKRYWHKIFALSISVSSISI